MFYPIRFMRFLRRGATGKDLGRELEDVVVQVGENPSQGVRTIAALRHVRVEVSSGPFNLAGVGSSLSATAGTGPKTGTGVREKHPTVNSSTMKGGKPLAGKLCLRRCRTVNTLHRRVRGRFSLRTPEIAEGLRANLAWAGAWGQRCRAAGMTR